MLVIVIPDVDFTAALVRQWLVADGHFKFVDPLRIIEYGTEQANSVKNPPNDFAIKQIGRLVVGTVDSHDLAGGKNAKTLTKNFHFKLSEVGR